MSKNVLQSHFPWKKRAQKELKGKIDSHENLHVMNGRLLPTTTSSWKIYMSHVLDILDNKISDCLLEYVPIGITLHIFTSISVNSELSYA